MDRQQLQHTLAEIFSLASGRPLVSLEESQSIQEGLGLDSLGLVTVAVEVQDRFDIALELDEVRHVVTVGDLLTLLESKLPAPAVRRAA